MTKTIRNCLFVLAFASLLIGAVCIRPAAVFAAGPVLPAKEYSFAGGEDVDLFGGAEIKGDCLVLDGSAGTYAQIADLPAQGAFTLSVTLAVHEHAAWNRVWEFALGANEYLSLVASYAGETGSIVVEYNNGNEKYDVTDDAFYLETSVFTDIACVFEGDACALYIDGRLRAEGAMPLSSDFSRLTLGAPLYYADAPIIADYDSLRFYSEALDSVEVAAEAGEVTIEDDARAVAQEAEKLDELIVWNGESKIALPRSVGEGVTVTWASSDTNVIDEDGTVFVPEEAVEVTLTARLQRRSSVLEHSVTLTIMPQSVFVPEKPAGLDSTAYAKGSYYEKLMQTNLAYMLSLNKDRLLFNFRRIAQLPTNVNGVTESYGGWIAPERNGAGQFEGSYLSALAQATQSMPDYRYEGESAAERLEYMLSALEECQNRYAEIDPQNAGYLAAFSVENIDAVESGRTVLSDGTSPWCPYYTIHKIMAGLYDVYRLVGGELGEQARAMLVREANWVYGRISDLSAGQRRILLSVEYGGMNEVLYNVYGITHNANHMRAAKFFEPYLFKQLARNEDPFTYLHANTAIPKLIGAARAYEITGDETYRKIAENGWEFIVQRIYAMGGTSDYELWPAIGEMSPSDRSAETCCSYNMLKLTELLYSWSGDVKYADYYERTFVNHILGSMDPETGCKTYHVPTGWGYSKLFHTYDTSFWCCGCTGLESFTKLQRGMYYENEDGVTINRYLPSEYTGESISLSIEGDYLTDESARVCIHSSGRFALALRIPFWAEGATAFLNGQERVVHAQDGYWTIERDWEAGDEVQLFLPMTYRTEALNSDADAGTLSAILYGPMVLVADLGSEGVHLYSTRQEEFDSLMNTSARPWLYFQTEQLGESIERVNEGGSLSFIVRAVNQTLTFRPLYQVFDHWYGMYLQVFNFRTQREAIEAHAAELAACLDSVQIGRLADEYDHGMLFSAMDHGWGMGRTWRAANAGQSFSYSLRTGAGEHSLLLRIDAGMQCSFQIKADGVTLGTFTAESGQTDPSDDRFSLLTVPIPQELTQGKERIRVEFYCSVGRFSLYGIGLYHTVTDAAPAETVLYTSPGKLPELPAFVYSSDGSRYEVVWERENLSAPATAGERYTVTGKTVADGRKAEITIVSADYREGLISAYSFEECSRIGSGYYTSENSVDGVSSAFIRNGVPVTYRAADGKEYGAVSLSGEKDSYIELSTQGLAQLQSFTISIRFSLNSSKIDGWERLFDFGTNKNFMMLALNGRFDANECLVYEDGLYGGTLGLKQGEWNMFTVTFDGSVAKVFLNGEEIGRNSAFEFDANEFTFNTARIGYSLVNPIKDPNLNACVSDFRIYNRALCQNEVRALFDERGKIVDEPNDGGDVSESEQPGTGKLPVWGIVLIVSGCVVIVGGVIVISMLVKRR